VSSSDPTRAPGGPAALADAPPNAERGERNRLLASMPDEVYARLLPHLESVDLPLSYVLWRSNAPILSVYFPRTAVISLMTPVEGEAPVEAATVGWEGMAGVPVVLGAAVTNAQALAQIPGEAARIDAGRIGEVLAEADGARTTLLRYAQALHDQTAQSVACNRRHAIEERCARWLLATQDRVGSDAFPLTHNFLAAMLGVRRASVTVVAGMLQHAGLIRYSRGRITVLDRERLEDASCECYRVVRAQYERLLGSPGA
jgi:CRP-like cAMP-binding protein